jgi:predicted RNA-binding protein YlxR (DUF448 family)
MTQAMLGSPAPQQPAPAPEAGGESHAEADEATHRRCLVTGTTRPKAELLRFVVGPGSRIVPDITGRLPGRGLWLTARRDILAQAVGKRLFQRAARAPVAVDEGLADRIEGLLAARCCELLGLARRAGQVVTGFVKVRTLLAKGGAVLLVEAADGGADARGRLERLAPGMPVVDRLTCAELSAAFGREHVVHVALAPGRLAGALSVEAARLDGFRAAGMKSLKSDDTGA